MASNVTGYAGILTKVLGLLTLANGSVNLWHLQARIHIVLHSALSLFNLQLLIISASKSRFRFRA